MRQNNHHTPVFCEPCNAMSRKCTRSWNFIKKLGLNPTYNMKQKNAKKQKTSPKKVSSSSKWWIVVATAKHRTRIAIGSTSGCRFQKWNWKLTSPHLLRAFTFFHGELDVELLRNHLRNDLYGPNQLLLQQKTLTLLSIPCRTFVTNLWRISSTAAGPFQTNGSLMLEVKGKDLHKQVNNNRLLKQHFDLLDYIEKHQLHLFDQEWFRAETSMSLEVVR